MTVAADPVAVDIVVGIVVVEEVDQGVQASAYTAGPVDTKVVKETVEES